MRVDPLGLTLPVMSNNASPRMVPPPIPYAAPEEEGGQDCPSKDKILAAGAAWFKVIRLQWDDDRADVRKETCSWKETTTSPRAAKIPAQRWDEDFFRDEWGSGTYVATLYAADLTPISKVEFVVDVPSDEPEPEEEEDENEDEDEDGEDEGMSSAPAPIRPVTAGNVRRFEPLPTADQHTHASSSHVPTPDQQIGAGPSMMDLPSMIGKLPPASPSAPLPIPSGITPTLAEAFLIFNHLESIRRQNAADEQARADAYIRQREIEMRAQLEREKIQNQTALAQQAQVFDQLLKLEGSRRGLGSSGKEIVSELEDMIDDKIGALREEIGAETSTAIQQVGEQVMTHRPGREPPKSLMQEIGEVVQTVVPMIPTIQQAFTGAAPAAVPPVPGVES